MKIWEAQNQQLINTGWLKIEIKAENVIWEGASEETILTLAHSLPCFSDLVTHLLVKKKLKFLLIGRIKNDLIERRFILIRHLSGNHFALDASTFAHNERTLLLTLVSQLCTNGDGSHNKGLYNQFFDDVRSTVKATEKVEVEIKKMVGIKHFMFKIVFGQ